MAISHEINFPPEDLFKFGSGKSPNYESFILWMLNNNEQCSWADFSAKVRPATLSHYLNALLESGSIQRVKRSLYKITPNGRLRYTEITTSGPTQDRKLSIPPETILRKRNYEHMILWVCYNNSSCKWSDFREKPLLINQSSLSKAIKILVNQGFIRKNDREYLITQTGKSEYTQMLQFYNLDRQAILEEETKRIEEITRLTIHFFDQNKIADTEIKFRFLNNALKFDYAKLKDLLPQEDFNKILLFLAINHPNNYPKSLSPSEFAGKYGIEQRVLDYYLYEFVESKSNLYPTKFFKINDDQGKTYYFQANEKLEGLLRVIVEDYVSKFTYLNKLYEHDHGKIQTPNFSPVLSQIIRECCTNIFHPNFAQSLEQFLPHYIKYLAYKIESQKQIATPLDKLEGVAWLNIPEAFQSSKLLQMADLSSSRCDQGEFSYNLAPELLNVLPSLWLSRLDFFRDKGFKHENFSHGILPLVDIIERNLLKGDYGRAKEKLKENQRIFSDFEYAVLQNLVSSLDGDQNQSLQNSTVLIQLNPSSYVGYLFYGIALLESNNVQKSLEIINVGINQTPHFLLSCLKVFLTNLLNNNEGATELLEDLNKNHPNHPILLRLKIILQLFEGQKYKEALMVAEQGITLYPKDSHLYLLKLIVLCNFKRFNEILELLQKGVDFKISAKDNDFYITVLFLKTYSMISIGDLNSAIDVIDVMQKTYSHHSLTYFIKTILHGYDFIYEYLSERSTLGVFLEESAKTLDNDRTILRKTWYYFFKCLILMEMDDATAALDAINTAIEISPKYRFYKFKLKVYEITNHLPECMTLVEEMLTRIPSQHIDILSIKAAIYLKMEQYDLAIKIVEEILHQNPRDLKALNDKTYALFYTGQKEDALTCAQQMIAINPSDGNAHDSYGELLMLCNQITPALEQFKIALELDPYEWYSIDTRYKMAKCYAKLGMYKEAIEWLDKGKESIKVAITCCSFTSRAWVAKLEKHKKQLLEHVANEENVKLLSS